MSFNWAQLAVGETVRSGCSNQGFQRTALSPSSPLPLGTTLDCIAEISGALQFGSVGGLVRAVHETLAGFGLWSGRFVHSFRANSTNRTNPDRHC